MRRALLALGLFAAAACEGGRYTVVVRFDPPELARRAVRIELAVVRSCGEQSLGEPALDAISRLELVRAGSPEPLGSLAPGTYGLYGRAVDETCRVFAAGCAPIAVVAGGSGELAVTLVARDAPACPSGSGCRDGVCTGVGDAGPGDAGRRDAGRDDAGGRDAGRDDAGGRDAGRDDAGDGGAGRDAGCRCAPCADCTGGGCVPVHTRCAASEVCDPSIGCVPGVPCESACPDDGDECTLERCDEARSLCIADRAADGAACASAGVAGACRAGRCCTGCWDGATCVGGTSPEACGARGAACATCDDGNECTDDACSATGCTHTADDTNACAGGTCHAGACCTGCWDGSACQPGTLSAACGAAGTRCVACACPTGGCSAGACAPARRVRVASAEGFHTCAVTDDGALFCWGENDSGQIGTGAVGGDETSPRRVGVESDWLTVSCAQEHCCGVRAPDQLWCWGSSRDGQLGLGDRVSRPTPTRLPGAWTTELWMWDDDATARRGDDAVLVWGENDDGDLGLGHTTDMLTPTLLAPPAGATRWATIGTGWEHACGIDSLGRLFCWGANELGQLGLGTASTVDQLSPARVGTVMDWIAVDGGEHHTCGIRADASLWCWGRNHQGMLGLGTTDSSAHPLPERVGTATDWVVVIGGEDHTCALNRREELHCWGENQHGQIGLGTATSSVDSPTRVGTSSDWLQVTLGENHSCGVRRGGTLYCWGANTGSSSAIGGQLGQGDRMQRELPAAVCFPP